MKTTASSLWVVLALVCLAPWAAAQQDLEARLVAIEKSSWEGWKNNDPAPFEEHMADNARVVLADGSEHDKAEVVEMIASGGCEVVGYELSGFEFATLGGGAAMVSYHASQDAVCDGQQIPPELVVSSVYTLDGDRWSNVLYQETVVHQEPVAGEADEEADDDDSD